MSTTLAFSGRVGGVTYDDPALFEEAARGLGYRGVKGRRVFRWAIGTEVVLRVDDVDVRGQVWDRGPQRDLFWVALEDGTYALLHGRGSVRGIYDTSGHSLDRAARIAS